VPGNMTAPIVGEGHRQVSAFLGVPSLSGQGSTVGNFVEHCIKIINFLYLQVNYKRSLIMVRCKEKGHDLFIKKKGLFIHPTKILCAFLNFHA
jgi:hypothetical protein